MTTLSDFSPSTRNSAIWSGDSRKVAQGKANEVILTKLGKMEIPDLSGNEAVQMGHVMEPVIGRLAQDKLKVELTKIEEALTHPKEAWLRSHFDFAGKEDGQTILVECKNYNAGVRSKFDAEAGIIPAADMAQLVHEAAVFGVQKIYLAVLFGGQEFFLAPFHISDQQKDDLVKQMADVWARVQTQNPYPAESVEQAKLLYPVSTEEVMTANANVEKWCQQLAYVKREIKNLEKSEEELQAAIQAYMGEKGVLSSFDGSVLATWKSAKASKKFDSKLFQSAMPDIYNQFVVETPGSRRFLIK